MTAPQKTIVNCITGETFTRDFSETELAEHEAVQAQAIKDAATKAKADQAAADKRQQILDRLGLTTDEFQTLIS
jgi:predicted DNA-binding protein YlxM (UPF0122 family)